MLANPNANAMPGMMMLFVRCAFLSNLACISLFTINNNNNK